MNLEIEGTAAFDAVIVRSVPEDDEIEVEGHNQDEVTTYQASSDSVYIEDFRASFGEDRGELHLEARHQDWIYVVAREYGILQITAEDPIKD